MAADSEFTPVVRRLGCLRGVSTLTGFAPGRRDRRLAPVHRRQIGAYLGLVPTEYSSGATRSQGSITKTGNTHARRLLVEAAWHHRARYRPGKTMRDRWDLATAAARARGACRATSGCTTAGSCSPPGARRPVVANVAIARELAGWCWSLAVLDD